MSKNGWGYLSLLQDQRIVHGIWMQFMLSLEMVACPVRSGLTQMYGNFSAHESRRTHPAKIAWSIEDLWGRFTDMLDQSSFCRSGKLK